jgi:hypothetical protein
MASIRIPSEAEVAELVLQWLKQLKASRGILPEHTQCHANYFASRGIMPSGSIPVRLVF